MLLIADSVGSIISYDVLSQSSLTSTPYSDTNSVFVNATSGASAEAVGVLGNSVDNRFSFESSSASSVQAGSLVFEVSDFFMLGSPTGLVMAYRRLLHPSKLDEELKAHRSTVHWLAKGSVGSQTIEVKFLPQFQQKLVLKRRSAFARTDVSCELIPIQASDSLPPDLKRLCQSLY